MTNKDKIIRELKDAMVECLAEGDRNNATIYSKLIKDYEADIIK